MDSNLAEFQAKLQRLINEQLPKAVENGMNKAVLYAEAEAKKITPTDSAYLRDHIESEVKQQGKFVQGSVYTNVEYAVYVHEGTGIYAKKKGRKKPWIYYHPRKGELIRTRGQKPKEFISKAILSNTSEIKKVMKKGIEETMASQTII